VKLDAQSPQRLEGLEIANPVRRFAWTSALAAGVSADGAALPSKPSDSAADAPLAHSNFQAYRAKLDAQLWAATMNMPRTLEAPGANGPRELAILRLTSAADLTSQKYGAEKMFGWSVLHITKQAAGVPRINRVSFMLHKGPDAFSKVATVDVDRTKSLTSRGPQNPVDQLFDW